MRTSRTKSFCSTIMVRTSQAAARFVSRTPRRHAQAIMSAMTSTTTATIPGFQFFRFGDREGLGNGAKTGMEARRATGVGATSVALLALKKRTDDSTTRSIFVKPEYYPEY